MSVVDKGAELSKELIGFQRTFNLCLVVAHHVKGLSADLSDAMKYKDAFAAPIQGHIASAQCGGINRFYDCFVPAGKKQRIHAVPLRFDFYSVSITEKLLNIEKFVVRIHIFNVFLHL